MSIVTSSELVDTISIAGALMKKSVVSLINESTQFLFVKGVRM